MTGVWETRKATKNREVITRPCGVVVCPVCGSDVTLFQETNEWCEDKATGFWKHSAFGPGIGECCGLAMLDDPWADGVQAFRIEGEPK